MIKIKSIAIISGFIALAAEAAAASEIEILKSIPVAISSPEAEVILGDAVLSATVAEIEKRKHEKGSTAFRFVGGLQTVLFNDDFNFAAHFDPRINPNDLDRTCESVLKALGEKSIDELERSLKSSVPKPRPSLPPGKNDSIKNVYGMFTDSGVHGFAQIKKAMAPLKGNLMRTDLYKDACFFVGFNQRIDLFIKEGLEHNEELVNDSLSLNQSQEQQLRHLANQEELNDGTIRSFEALRESARAIFAHRFEHIHGLDSGRTFEVLSKTALSPSAAVIRIPAP